MKTAFIIYYKVTNINSYMNRLLREVRTCVQINKDFSKQKHKLYHVSSHRVGIHEINNNYILSPQENT